MRLSFYINDKKTTSIVLCLLHSELIVYVAHAILVLYIFSRTPMRKKRIIEEKRGKIQKEKKNKKTNMMSKKLTAITIITNGFLI